MAFNGHFRCISYKSNNMGKSNSKLAPNSRNFWYTLFDHKLIVGGMLESFVGWWCFHVYYAGKLSYPAR